MTSCPATVQPAVSEQPPRSTPIAESAWKALQLARPAAPGGPLEGDKGTSGGDGVLTAPATPVCGSCATQPTAARPKVFVRNDSAWFARNDGQQSGDSTPARGLALVQHLGLCGAVNEATQARLDAACAATAAAQEDAACLRQQLQAAAGAAAAAQQRAASGEAEAARLARQLAQAQRNTAAQLAGMQARLTASEQRGRELETAVVAAADARRAAEMGRAAAEHAALAAQLRLARLQDQNERQRVVISSLAASRGSAFEERFSLRMEAQKAGKELGQAQRVAGHLQKALDQHRASKEAACCAAAEEAERAAAERWHGRVSTLRKQLSEARRKLQASKDAELSARAELAAERELLEQAHAALSADHAVLSTVAAELAAELAVLRKQHPPAAGRAARLTLQRAGSTGSGDTEGEAGGGASRPASPATPLCPISPTAATVATE